MLAGGAGDANSKLSGRLYFSAVFTVEGGVGQEWRFAPPKEDDNGSGETVQGRKQTAAVSRCAESLHLV